MRRDLARKIVHNDHVAGAKRLHQVLLDQASISRAAQIAAGSTRNVGDLPVQTQPVRRLTARAKQVRLTVGREKGAQLITFLHVKKRGKRHPFYA